MKEINKTNFASFYARNKNVHLYPTEWIIRTLLGNYPEMRLDKTKYENSKILDIGFGDGRNFPLLNNCGFSIFGVETTQDNAELVKEEMKSYNIDVTLTVGSNSHLPFENNYFDYILSSFVWYYIDEGKTFKNNLEEYHRVLNKGGVVIATLAAPGTFIFKNGIDKGEGHIEITNDIFNLRNGDILKCFYSEKEIVENLEPYFQDIKIGRSTNNYFGLAIDYFMVVAQKS